jgi:hypothetical protein
MIPDHNKMEVALERILDWIEAYPEDIFPPVTADYRARAHAALTMAGLSLDRISADAMRHVITRVGEIARDALGVK